MKIKTHNLVSLALALVFFFNTIYSKASSQEDFITIYTTVFHPGPSVDASKTVEWDFNGDGVTDSTQLDGSYVFPGPGTYSVKLKVKDAVSETITTKTISISESLVPTGPVVPENWMSQAWSNRIKITIKAAKIAGDLTDFPVYLNLGILPSEFFTTVQSSGADIRVTKADGKAELAREVVSVDKVNKTGELHFKADALKAGVDNEFYIYFGNQTATEIGGQSVWTNGYVGVWHMQNDPSNSILIDSSGNNNMGTSVGAMTTSQLLSGKLGKTINFDGVNDYFSLGTPVSLSFASSSMTVSLWYKGSDTSTYKHLISKTGSGTSTFQWGFGIYGGGIDRVFLSTASAPNFNDFLGSTTNISNGSWRFLTGTKVQGGNSTVYVDGNNDGSGSTNNIVNQPSVPVTIGARSNEGSRSQFYLAQLDEVRLSKIARSPEWIKTEYNNQNDNPNFFVIGTNESI